jgi:nitrite reductase (NADH) small subunit
MSWVDIGAIDDIPVRGARVLKSPAGCIAIFRTAEAEVFAVADKCPHKGGPLSEGIVHENKVTCPLHNWVFDLNTGEAQGADEGSIDTYAVRTENGRILFDTESIMARNAA